VAAVNRAVPCSVSVAVGPHQEFVRRGGPIASHRVTPQVYRSVARINIVEMFVLHCKTARVSVMNRAERKLARDCSEVQVELAS
jgi:hypothetical protein